MRTLILLLVFISVSEILFAQDEKKLLRNIESIEDVGQFNKSHEDYRLQYFELSNVKEMTASSKSIYENKDRVFQQNGKWIKEIDRDTYTGSNVRYLFLNGEELEKEELLALRDSLYQVYLEDPNEAKFMELAEKYTMDGNTDQGLLEWYDPMSVVKKFADGVVDGEVDTVFKIDVRSRRWYYLVYKLDEEKKIHKRSFVVLIKK